MKKLLIGGGIAAVALISIVAAAVILWSLPTTVTVNEAFTTTSTDCTISALPGETYICNITISNAASVPLYADFAWTLTDAGGVTFTTNMPLTAVEIAPGEGIYGVNFMVDEGSAVGEVTGTVDISRVSAPV